MDLFTLLHFNLQPTALRSERGSSLGFSSLKFYPSLLHSCSKCDGGKMHFRVQSCQNSNLQLNWKHRWECLSFLPFRIVWRRRLFFFNLQECLFSFRPARSASFSQQARFNYSHFLPSLSADYRRFTLHLLHLNTLKHFLFCDYYL